MKNCYNTSNNKYFDCPPRMADGRHFTDYRPNCYVNNLLRANNKISDSFNYRSFLTDNANSLMNINRAYACQKNCCGSCTKPYNTGTMLPEETMVYCDKTNCNVNVNNVKGLGQGRDYGLKTNCNKWPSKFPINQPYNCCSDDKNLFNYYNNSEEEESTRHSIPSGGKIMSGGDPTVYN